MTKPFCDWLCQDTNAVDAFSNEDREEEFEKDQMMKLKAADCMAVTSMSLPCLIIPFCCISSCVKEDALCNLPDARKLSEKEAKPYIGELQGGRQNIMIMINLGCRWLDYLNESVYAPNH